MIDRGALVVAKPTAGASPYRGVHRPGLDAQTFTGRKGRDLAQRYREGLVAGDGVLEDLDDAIALRDAAAKIGVTNLEVIVFEFPQEPRARAGALPLAQTPPAEGLVLLGYDVIEMLEPFWSPLAAASDARVNEHGLFATRAEADAYRDAWVSAHPDEEPVESVRVWV